ncbi:MAG: RagB/SusD family nutrient uptake outer membrane protein [Fermentimonas sp.]|nr:RagB/SusD family nutrient uptake outer membrane protein [Fermentimonas sp.]
MNKILIILVAVISVFSLNSCVDMDLVPQDSMTSAQLASDPAGIELTTIGAYRWFRQNRPGLTGGSTSRSVYARNWFQMNEFRGDNVFIAGVTSDPFMKSYEYTDSQTEETTRYFWYASYSILNILNTNIGVATEGTSAYNDHILGENYFLRALVYLNLCDIYARPYTHGANNPAVVLRTENTSPDEEITRATIGEVYAQIESDLKKAIQLMDGYRRSTNASFAWKGSAQGLLSRLYLNMERNQEVVDIVNEMLAGRSAQDVLDPDLATYFTRTQTSEESLWVIGYLSNESPGTSSVASMYLTDPASGTGWGEIYPSDPFYELMTRYAEDDVRWNQFHLFQPLPTSVLYKGESPKWMANWPVANPASWYHGLQYRYLDEDENGKFIIFSDAMDEAIDDDFFSNTSTKIYIQEETVNTYTKYFFMHNGQKINVTVTPATNNRMSYRKIFNKKLSYQDGNPMLCSYPMVRWGEVILNRAEAYAKLNNPAAALADVNAIRSRAGLSGDQLMTQSNMTQRGYPTVLDVVLDERRLELAYEGFRWKDLYRNNKSMDRRYGGTHPWEVIQANDPRIPHQISGDEMLINPGVLPNVR